MEDEDIEFEESGTEVKGNHVTPFLARHPPDQRCFSIVAEL